jgi:hypothetical protein
MRALQLIGAASLVVLGAAVDLVAATRPEPGLGDDLGRRASWVLPTGPEVELRLDQWLEMAGIAPETALQVKQVWLERAADVDLLDRLAAALRNADPEIARLVDFCREAKRGYLLPQFEILARENAAPLVKANLRLLYGRWLAANGYYDECVEQLASVQAAEVVDPAALLFLQGVSYYRLLNKAECLQAIEKLLEHEPEIPRRYSAVAKLMLEDIKPLKPDSLDEVSRLMDSIKVRLGHARAGKRVRKEEDDVVAKLDKLIDKLEQQQQAAAAMASGTPGNAKQSSNPMQDSMPAGGTGPGNVAPKKLDKQGDWGNLPPKEREEALQQLGKDFPSHYRDVIEEYFRKLAREGASEEGN